MLVVFDSSTNLALTFVVDVGEARIGGGVPDSWRFESKNSSTSRSESPSASLRRFSIPANRQMRGRQNKMIPALTTRCLRAHTHMPESHFFVVAS